MTFVPKYRNSLNELSVEAIKIHMKAKFIMVTHGFLVPSRWKKEEQIYVMLWHGCGYKDTSNKGLENNGIRGLNLVFVPGGLFIKAKAKFWKISEKFLLPMGQPRYNWMLQITHQALNYAEKFKNGNEKIIIWMPTFRNAKRGRMLIRPEYLEGKIEQFPLLKNENDWKKIDDYCERYGISLLIKLHNYQKEYDIDFSKFTHIFAITNDDIERNGVQLYEFLAVTDALITDYSSVAFDYLLLNKPIGFILDDFELYKKTRGFVFENPLEYMPGHHIYTCEQLKEFLKDVVEENDIYKDYRSRVKAQAIHDSKDYCKEILDCLNI